ncbi:MAG: hypothetical protein IKN38_03235 [Clostridia bacterium]|nr:hypothetical protein [Clostridia bacterium]
MRKGLKRLLSLLIVVMMIIPTLPAMTVEVEAGSATTNGAYHNSDGTKRVCGKALYGATAGNWPDGDGRAANHYVYFVMKDSNNFDNVILDIDICPLTSDARIDALATGTYHSISFNLASHTIGINDRTISYNTSTFVWKPGEWHHVRIFSTYNSASGTNGGSIIWIDGTSVGACLNSASNNNTARLGYKQCINLINCGIDNVMLYSSSANSQSYGSQVYFEDFEDGNLSGRGDGTVPVLDCYKQLGNYCYELGNGKKLNIQPDGLTRGDVGRIEFDVKVPGSLVSGDPNDKLGGPYIDSSNGRVGFYHPVKSGGTVYTSYGWSSNCWYHVTIDGRTNGKIGAKVWINSQFIGTISDGTRYMYARWELEVTSGSGLLIDNIKVTDYSGNVYFEDFEDQNIGTGRNAVGNTTLTASGSTVSNLGSGSCNGSYNNLNTSNGVHPFSSSVTSPTCTAGGYTTYTCSCGRSYTGNNTSALGHSYGSWTNYSNASNHKKTCSRCGDVQTQAHSFPDAWTEVTPPTCTDAGTSSKTCSVCWYVKYAYPDPLGHSYTVNQGTTAPTCQAQGYTTYKCSRCSSTERRDYTATVGHSYTVFVSTVSPTCTTGGYDTYKCQWCSATTTKNATSATGHSFTSYVSDGNATCTADGTKTASCDNGCGTTSTIADTGSALGSVGANGLPTRRRLAPRPVRSTTSVQDVRRVRTERSRLTLPHTTGAHGLRSATNSTRGLVHTTPLIRRLHLTDGMRER